MNIKGTLTGVGVSFVLITVGFLAGRAFPSRNSPDRPVVPALPQSKTGTSIGLPPVPLTTDNNRVVGNAAEASTRKLQVADIEERIRNLKDPRALFSDWNRLLDSIEEKDLLHFLQFSEKSAPRNARNMIRSGLLNRLAKIDTAKALEFAQTIKVRNEREDAIASTIGGWGGKDPE